MTAARSAVSCRAGGYGDGADPAPCGWYPDVDKAGRQAELAFPPEETDGYAVEIQVTRIDACDRYSAAVRSPGDCRETSGSMVLP
ncbi:hypothetical protein [Geminicoccus harenae]|uniref:hypothetical protein n=1 Tax=Geminicoccus harenae TaxID=2498453 RepID=UPI00168BA73E|nr:hypothetical protein [Geminicoccus harenae]